jgi:hypothetical protein
LVGVVKELPEEEAPTPRRNRRGSHPGRRRWHAKNNSGKSKSNGGNRRQSNQH